METKIVVETSWKAMEGDHSGGDGGGAAADGGEGIAKASYLNVTTYTIDVTDLR